MGRRRVWGLFAVVLAIASFVASAPALGAAPTAQDFTDWTAVSGAPAVATGTLHGQAVTLSGTHVFAPPVSVVDGHWTFFSGPDFSPALPTTDVIQVGAAITPESYTITFATPVTDPELEIGSLGSRLDFPTGTTINRITGQPGFTVTGSTITGAPSTTLGPDGINDSNGTVQLIGTYTTITFTATFAGSTEDGVILQIGAASPPPPPPPPPPPATGGSTPVARLSLVRTLGTRGLTLFSAASTVGAATHFNWDLNGDHQPDVTCPGSTPYLGVRSVSPLSSSVTLTAVGTGGSTSTSQQLGLTGLSLTHRLTIAPPTTITCSADQGLIRGSALHQALSTFCFTPSTVTFGIVEAKGCFTHVLSEDDVPSAERQVVHEYYNEAKVAAASQRVCASNPTSASCTDAISRAGALDLYVSLGAVHLNGMTFIPRPGASVVVFPALQRVVSSNASVSLGLIPIASGAVDFDLKNTVKTLSGSTIGASAPLLTVDARRYLPSVGGFTVAGQMQLSLLRRGATRSTQASMRLTLPPLFDAFGGQPPSGGVVASADNTTSGLVLDHLDLSLPEADLGPLSFRKMSFVYSAHGNTNPQCSRDWWKANGEISLDVGSNPTLSLAPPPTQNGIAFCAGAFRSAGAALTFNNALEAPEVFPGVTLQQIAFALATHPTLIRGGVQLGVLGFGNVHGTILVGFPSNGEPYTLLPADASNPGEPGKPGDLTPLAGRKITTAFVAAGGSVSVDLPEPIGPSRLGSGYFFVSGDELALGGETGGSVPGMSVHASFSGDWGLKTHKFQISGQGEACVAGFEHIPLLDDIACFGGGVWVGSNGIAACYGDITHDSWHPGAGYHWGDTWPKIWLDLPALHDGCRPSQYWITDVTRARDAAGALTFTVAPGERSKNVELDGVSGAPNIVIHGPGGAGISSAPQTFVENNTFAVLRQDAGHVTWVGVRDATPGQYTISLLPGSAPIKGMAATRPHSDVLTTTVTGTGAHRTLHYVIGSPAGKQVAFLERGPAAYHQIGVAHGGRGTIRFTPVAGPGAVRQIVAQTVLNGVPAPDLVVARFRVAAPRRVSRPRGLKVARRATSLLVSWRPVAGATRYGVVVTQRAAAQRLLKLSSRHHSIRVRGVALTQAGTVAVSAQGSTPGWGKPANARFGATRKPFTVLHPFRLLGKPPNRRH